MLTRWFKEDFDVVAHSVAIPKKIDELQMQKGVSSLNGKTHLQGNVVKAGKAAEAEKTLLTLSIG